MAHRKSDRSHEGNATWTRWLVAHKFLGMLCLALSFLGAVLILQATFFTKGVTASSVAIWTAGSLLWAGGMSVYLRRHHSE